MHFSNSLPFPDFHTPWEPCYTHTFNHKIYITHSKNIYRFVVFINLLPYYPGTSVAETNSRCPVGVGRSPCKPTSCPQHWRTSLWCGSLACQGQSVWNLVGGRWRQHQSKYQCILVNLTFYLNMVQRIKFKIVNFSVNKLFYTSFLFYGSHPFTAW